MIVSIIQRARQHAWPIYVLVALLGLAPQVASAQSTSLASSAQTVGAAAAQSPAPFTAGWRDGFFLQTDDGAFQLKIGLLTHADGRFALDDVDENVVNAFTVRRLRPALQGRILQRFEFNLNPDFAGGTLAVHDAFIDTRFSTGFRLRVGKSKVPFGFERLQSASSMLFIERALPTALAPNRDIGVQVLGDLAGSRVSYAAGVSNGVTDGASADTDTNDSKDVAGRILVRPVTGLGIALAGSRGEQTTLPTFRTALLQQTFLSYAGAVGDGVRVRYSPQLSYYHRQFGGFAEYVHSKQPIRRGAIADDVTHEAWQVAASWVITGENATERGVRPRRNFAFGGDGAGAVQVAVRYHSLSVGGNAIELGLAAPGASRKAEAYTVGVNWYLNPFFKYVVNFERTVFDGGEPGSRPAENAFVFRTQLGF